jgi:flavin-dependent dehydrogenase
MTSSTSADVLVAGAGLAGAAAALALARRGLTVLLADPGPTDPPYELLITAPALASLDLLGVPTGWTTRLDALELRFGRPLVLSDAGLAVADQRTLRRTLRAAAVEAGARSLTGTVRSLAWKDGCRHAVVTRPDAEPAPVTARNAAGSDHPFFAKGRGAVSTGRSPRPSWPETSCLPRRPASSRSRRRRCPGPSPNGSPS